MHGRRGPESFGGVAPSEVSVAVPITAEALPGTTDPAIITTDRLLATGEPLTRRYRLLSAVAVGGIVLFAIAWASMLPGEEYPLLFAAATIGLLHYVGVWLARWVLLSKMARPQPLAPEPGLRVAVGTSFVPGAEDLAMLEVTLRALFDMDYPHDTWVLDEGSSQDVRDLCERMGVRYFTRLHDPRYVAQSGSFAANSKYGNYNAWLDAVVDGTYDYVATFDPDHVPSRDFLSKLLGYFRDPAVGCVQAPQVYYNQEASFIARGAAEESYAFYSSFQMAYHALGYPVVIGSHGVHRLSALRSVGGFPAHEAEDLYLTMLYRARKWRGVYVPRILALGAAPVDWDSYLGQQRRWGRAIVDLKLRTLPVLAAKLSWPGRVIALFHGAHYFRPLLFLLILLMLMAMLVWNAVPTFLSSKALLAVGALLATLALVDRFRDRFALDPVRERGPHLRAPILSLAKWPILFLGFIEALLGRHEPYRTTRKTGTRLPLSFNAGLLAPTQLGVALLVSLAVAIGVARHGTLQPELWVAAGLVVAASLLLAWTESWRPPPAYDPRLLEERLAELRTSALWGARNPNDAGVGVRTSR